MAAMESHRPRAQSPNELLRPYDLGLAQAELVVICQYLAT